MGLSRNKVAVPEGAAGTPPFWSVLLSLKFIRLMYGYLFKADNKNYIIVLARLVESLKASRTTDTVYTIKIIEERIPGAATCGPGL